MLYESVKCKRRVYKSTKYKKLKFDRFSVCVWCRCKRRASVLQASFTISDLNYKCKTLHRGSVQMTWFFWDRVGLRKTEVFMKIKHILFMIQNSSQMQESEEPGYNNGVFLLPFCHSHCCRGFQNFQKFLCSWVWKSGLIIIFAVNPGTQSYTQIKSLSENHWAIFKFCTEVSWFWTIGWGGFFTTAKHWESINLVLAHVQSTTRKNFLWYFRVKLYSWDICSSAYTSSGCVFFKPRIIKHFFST